jgi:hypothetical protein
LNIGTWNTTDNSITRFMSRTQMASGTSGPMSFSLNSRSTNPRSYTSSPSAS